MYPRAVAVTIRVPQTQKQILRVLKIHVPIQLLKKGRGPIHTDRNDILDLF